MQDGGSGGVRPQGGSAPSQMHLQIHDQFFAQRVNRRVGDLGEALFEIVVEEVGLAGENRQGDVITHAIGGFFAGAGHVIHHQFQILSSETKCGLLLEKLEIAEDGLFLPDSGLQLAAMFR